MAKAMRSTDPLCMIGEEMLERRGIERERERERTFLVDGWEAEDEVLGATVVLRTTDLVHRKKNFD